MKPPIDNCDLLHRYVMASRTMRLSIRIGDAGLCDAANKMRNKLHDDILVYAGTTRNDMRFGYYLAQWLEEMLEAEENLMRELKECS